MSWKSNSENICKKITAGISAIRRVKPFVDKDTLISIYNAIVRPYFDYCCEVWDVFGESQSKRHVVKHGLDLGLDWTCKLWTGLVKHGLVKHGLVKHGLVKHGLVKHGLVKHGLVKHGLVKHGLVKHGLVKHGLVKHGLVKHGLVKHGLVKHGLVKHGLVKHGLVKHGLVKHGLDFRGNLLSTICFSICMYTYI